MIIKHLVMMYVLNNSGHNTMACLMLIKANSTQLMHAFALALLITEHFSHVQVHNGVDNELS